MEINKQQAELFLELLTRFESVPKKNNILGEHFGDITISVFDTYILKQKLREYIGE